MLICYLINNLVESMARSFFFHRYLNFKFLFFSIRLATKFLRFSQKFYFYFYFLASTVQIAFSYICTTTIYDLSPKLWQRQDPAFVEVLRLLTKEVDNIHFHTVLIVELFLTQVMRKRTKQMVVRRSQVRRIRWMRNGNPSELQ